MYDLLANMDAFSLKRKNATIMIGKKVNKMERV